MHIQQSADSDEQKKSQMRAQKKESGRDRETRTFVSVAQSVAFQRDFGFELLAAQIAEVTPLGVVPVHVGLQVVPAAAGVVAQVAGVRLQTCTQGHETLQGRTTIGSSSRGFSFSISCQEANKLRENFKCLASGPEISAEER